MISDFVHVRKFRTVRDMDCKDCEHGAYDEFLNDYICKKNDTKELIFYPEADAPVCELK